MLLQADGTNGAGTRHGFAGSREPGRFQVQGEQFEAQGDELRSDEGAGAPVCAGRSRSLVERARRCDEEEDRAYREHTGYELREDLRDKQQRLERIRQAKRALEAREAELRPGQAIEDKKQISFADKDARIMGKKGAFDYAYNAQVGVDGDAQIIVGQHVSQAANDQGEVARALDELEASSGRLPDKMSLDNGYYSGDNLQAMSDRGVEAYIATDRGEKPAKTGLEDSDRPLVKADFRYDEARDGFHCPGGQFLALRALGCRGPARVSGRDRSLRSLCLPCPLLSVEVRGGRAR